MSAQFLRQHPKLVATFENLSLNYFSKAMQGRTAKAWNRTQVFLALSPSLRPLKVPFSHCFIYSQLFYSGTHRIYAKLMMDEAGVVDGWVLQLIIMHGKFPVPWEGESYIQCPCSIAYRSVW